MTLREGLGKSARTELDEEIARVREWLETETPGGRGVAIFSCAPRDLWEAYRLPEVDRDELTFGPVPHVAPLLDIVDDYERYAVALVDKERARLFTVVHGPDRGDPRRSRTRCPESTTRAAPPR